MQHGLYIIYLHYIHKSVHACEILQSLINYTVRLYLIYAYKFLLHDAMLAQYGLGSHK